MLSGGGVGSLPLAVGVGALALTLRRRYRTDGGGSDGVERGPVDDPPPA